MSKLSVHLVAWNGAKYIPFLFDSLKKQTFKDWELLVIDNGSTDNSPDLIKKELNNFPVFVRFIQNKENVGFARGHNQAVRITGAHNTECFHAQHSVLCAVSDYIQLLNQDIYLAPDYFEKIVKMMEDNPQVGAGQGLLLKWDFNNVKCQMSNVKCELEDSLTNIIDTMGLQVLRNRRVVDYQTGRNLSAYKLTNLPAVLEVFGVSGALPVYRRSAIEQVMFKEQTRPTFVDDKSSVGQMFDEDFFMYKEDVDLAFRLRGAGWKAYTVSDARAWHDRSAAGPKQMTDKAALVNRKTKSAFINYHSYKNHLMVLLKNEHYANLAKDWPWIFWYEFKKFAYLLLFDRAILKGLKELWKLWSRVMTKRKFIMDNYKVNPREIRKWYV